MCVLNSVSVTLVGMALIAGYLWSGFSGYDALSSLLGKCFNEFVYKDAKLRRSLYRPFCKQYVFHDAILNEEPRLFSRIFPIETEQENCAIALTTLGSEKPYMSLLINTLTDLPLVGAGAGTQCFPFYIYDPDGSHRRENITDWALTQFRTHYDDNTITKWHIFDYVYGIL